MSVLHDLHAAGAPLDSPDEAGRTPLQRVLRNRWADAAEALLDLGARPEPIDGDGQGALHDACMAGMPLIVERLVVAGADPDARDALSGSTPAHFAAFRGDGPTIAALLRALDDEYHEDRLKRAKNDLGMTPREVAVAEGNLEAAELLVEPPERDPPVVAASKAGDAVQAQRWLGKGYDPNDRALDDHRPALHHAVASGSLALVDLLLDSGADLHAVDPAGWTALHVAAAAGKPAITARLIAAGADFLGTNGDGDTPAHLAGRNGSVETVKVLLRGDRPTVQSVQRAKNKAGRIPAEVAAAAGKDAAAELLTELTLHLCIARGDLQLAKLIVSEGADPTDIDPITGSTALCAAAGSRSMDIFRYLFSLGVDPDKAGPNGMTPLHAACAAGQVAAAKILLDHGASAAKEDNQGSNALHHAAGSGSLDVVELILADPESRLIRKRRNRAKLTPKDFAIASNSRVTYLFLFWF